MDLSQPFRVLAPTLDGPVLRVLAGTVEPMSRRQITNLVGDASEAGIRKVLRRLAAQGLIIEQRVGSQYTYVANREHILWPAVDVIESASQRLDEQIREYVEVWNPAPISAELFGSVAVGEATTESDVDLILYRPHVNDQELEIWDRQVAGLRAAVERWTGNRCEILEIDPLALVEMAAGNEAVLRSARVPISGIDLSRATPRADVAVALRKVMESRKSLSTAEASRLSLSEMAMTSEFERTLDELAKTQEPTVGDALRQSVVTS